LIVKSKEVYQAHAALAKLIEKEMPIKMAAKFYKLMSLLEKEIEILDKQKHDIIDRHVRKDANGEWDIQKDGNVPFLDKEHGKLCQDDLMELDEVECDIGFEGISQSELENINFELTIAQFAALEPFIV